MAMTVNPSIRIYINKRITFKFKTGYYLKSLLKVSKSTKNENGENVANF